METNSFRFDSAAREAAGLSARDTLHYSSILRAELDLRNSALVDPSTVFILKCMKWSIRDTIEYKKEEPATVNVSHASRGGEVSAILGTSATQPRWLRHIPQSRQSSRHVMILCNVTGPLGTNLTIYPPNRFCCRAVHLVTNVARCRD